MTNYQNLLKTRDLMDPAGVCYGDGGVFSIERAFNRIVHWYRRSQQRRQLKELDARLLKDVGLTIEQAEFEASKPFWMD